MSALLVLVPISVVLLGIAIWAFFWATDSGQFDDLDTPAVAMLEDDDARPTAAGAEPSDAVAKPREGP